MTDLLEHTRQRLRQQRLRTVADVRGAGDHRCVRGRRCARSRPSWRSSCAGASIAITASCAWRRRAPRFLQALFDEFCRVPELLPDRYRRRAAAGSVERTVCDYLAGMTDRYAQEEYLRLFQPFHRV